MTNAQVLLQLRDIMSISSITLMNVIKAWIKGKIILTIKKAQPSGAPLHIILKEVIFQDSIRSNCSQHKAQFDYRYLVVPEN